MKKGDQHIDKLAKQLLSDMEVQAPEGSWNKIATSLDEKQTKAIPIYKKLEFIAAAVVLIGALISSIFIFNDKEQNLVSDNTIITDDSTAVILNPTDTISTQIAKEQKVTEIEKPVEVNKKTTKQLQRTESTDNKTIMVQTEERVENSIASIQIVPFNKRIDFPSSLLKLYNIKLEENLDSWQASHADEILAQKDDHLKLSSDNWKLGIAYSPTYADNSSNPSQERALAADFGNKSQNYIDEKTKTTFTFGVNVSYALSQKISIQSGLYYQKHQNQISSNRLLVNSEDLNAIQLTKTSSGNINIMNDININTNDSFEYLMENNNAVAEIDPNADLIQNFAYLEIPMIFSYQLLDSRFDVYLQSGLHTGFVINNSVNISGFNSESIGSTDNINSVIFRSMIGISFEYPLSKQLFFNFTPSYKYQLNDLNRSVNFKSKFNFFDLKTGISYRF
ncbi:MAG: PorT family protein [Clostridia bacterium]|nr:PorT family protein [Clostridia bacterium]